MEKLYNWLVLSSIRGVGERSLKALFERFKGAGSILEADEKELALVVGQAKAKAIKDLKGVDEKKIKDIIKLLTEEDLGAVTIEDKDYPKEFMDLPDSPPVLFYRGNLKGVSCVGVVGPRNPSDYTLSLVDEIVDLAVDRGFGIVSGGAVGVDSRAHLRAVEKSGYTVCILGFGILKARSSLLKRIEKSNGVLISEFLPDQPADKHTFPKRNRLIASLSEFVVIPEASTKSGALITALWADLLGKKVYAHVGIGRSPRWRGCVNLIREGKAQIFGEPGQIFGNKVNSRGSLEEFLQTPRTVDEISDFLNLPHSEVFQILIKLEMEGKLTKMGSLYMSC